TDEALHFVVRSQHSKGRQYLVEIPSAGDRVDPDTPTRCQERAELSFVLRGVNEKIVMDHIRVPGYAHFDSICANSGPTKNQHPADFATNVLIQIFTKYCSYRALRSNAEGR